MFLHCANRANFKRKFLWIFSIYTSDTVVFLSQLFLVHKPMIVYAKCECFCASGSALWSACIYLSRVCCAYVWKRKINNSTIYSIESCCKPVFRDQLGVKLHFLFFNTNHTHTHTYTQVYNCTSLSVGLEG